MTILYPENNQPTENKMAAKPGKKKTNQNGIISFKASPVSVKVFIKYIANNGYSKFK